ncbi:MAG: DUF2934 domain-containing protein [Burkholderiales bacterium]|nr:DUF2934 domain-containing protein [Burkholderiales bacterium]
MAKSREITTPAKATLDSAEKNTGMLHSVTPEQRYHYVEVAAYYIAERRCFDAGYADEDWAHAELEIDRLLAEGQINR